MHSNRGLCSAKLPRKWGERLGTCPTKRSRMRAKVLEHNFGNAGVGSSCGLIVAYATKRNRMRQFWECWCRDRAFRSWPMQCQTATKLVRKSCGRPNKKKQGLGEDLRGVRGSIHKPAAFHAGSSLYLRMPPNLDLTCVLATGTSPQEFKTPNSKHLKRFPRVYSTMMWRRLRPGRQETEQLCYVKHGSSSLTIDLRRGGGIAFAIELLQCQCLAKRM